MSAPTTDSDASTGTPSYRLPTTVRPHAYRLVLTPDLPAATFAGDVEIDVTVERADQLDHPQRRRAGDQFRRAERR